MISISIFIKTIMTRCIHCTRCVRFCNEIDGVPFFTTFNRGVNTEIGNYNLELNLDPLKLEDDCFSKLHKQLESFLNKAKKKAAKKGAKIILTGILA